MNIEQYFQLDGEQLRFTRAQASNFAKSVAGDFNPIHDEDAKKFCVPGDLLFSVLLHRYGVSQQMTFEFAGMVNENTRLRLPVEAAVEFMLQDEDGKDYLGMQTAGEHCDDAAFVSALTEQYVKFSGRAFPHILVDLMRAEGVMINPVRPLVIYKNMNIQLDRFAAGEIELALDSATLHVEGKKGEVTLAFSITADGERIGSGTKNMLLSGLRPYDAVAMDGVVETYAGWKAAYTL